MATIFPLDRFRKLYTPFYYYDMQLLRDTVGAARDAAAIDSRFHIEYAVKANDNPEIVRVMAAAGFGADCVSGGEIERVMKYGIKASDITFAGVGKTDREIRQALHAGIGCFNVESLPELEVIAEIAAQMDKKARIALRVNPDIDAHTHHYITTGLAENKFGINMPVLEDVVNKALTFESVELEGLHFHIGSQITINEPFELLCERVNALVGEVTSRGVRISSVNMGGGLGIDYDNPDENPVPDFKSYFETFHRCLDLPAEVTAVRFELGRSLVAQCGSLITRVVYVKEGEKKRFAIVDAGMTDLIRPALYGAHHAVMNLSAEPSDTATLEYDVVGPVCESADVFAVGEKLPLTRRGDFLALRSAGAYGQVMASTYNGRPLAPAVYSL